MSYPLWHPASPGAIHGGAELATVPLGAGLPHPPHPGREVHFASTPTHIARNFRSVPAPPPLFGVPPQCAVGLPCHLEELPKLFRALVELTPRLGHVFCSQGTYAMIIRVVH